MSFNIEQRVLDIVHMDIAKLMSLNESQQGEGSVLPICSNKGRQECMKANKGREECMKANKGR